MFGNLSELVTHFRTKQPELPAALHGGSDPKRSQYETLSLEINRRRSTKSQYGTNNNQKK